MPKLLIVDDEEMIRAGLSQIVPRLLPSWQVIGACEDAASAWSAIAAERPDLLILDIGMPGESGLALADRLAREKPDIAIVMLTGFDKFDHVQAALRSGVSDYLLKPVQRDELKAAIMKAEENIEAKRRQRDLLFVQALGEWIVAGKPERLQALNSLLAEDGLLRPGVSFNLKLTIYLRDDDGACVSDPAPGKGVRQARVEADLDALRCAGAVVRKWVVVPLAEACDLLFVAGEGLPGAAELPVTEDERTTGTLSGCGDPVADPADLPTLFRTVQGRLLSETTTLEAASEAESEHAARLTAALEANDPAGAAAAIRQWAAWLRTDAALTMQGAFRLISFITGPQMNRAINPLIRALQPELARLTGRLLFSRDPSALLAEIEAFAERVASARHAVPEERKIIGRVKEMIRREYAKPSFTLEQAAASVYLNPTYLSELFKASTGQKFIDYITDVRLDEARRLLQETDMKMYEVCEAVGYTSSKYFSTLFRKRFDRTPTQYRELAGYGGPSREEP